MLPRTLLVAALAILASAAAAAQPTPPAGRDRAIVPENLPAPETDTSRALKTRPSYRLLVETEDVAAGPRVRKVAADSRTLKMAGVGNAPREGGMEAGDIITHVNGVKTPRTADYLRLVELSGGKPVTLTVIDVRTRNPYQWSVTPKAVEVPNAANAQNQPPKVHAVLLGDTRDPKIGGDVRADIDSLAEVFKGGKLIHPSRVGTVYTLTDREATPENLLAAIRALNPGPDDAVFVYCSCHGGNDPRYAKNDPQSDGHFIALNVNTNRGDLLHKTLRDHVYAKPGRLKIIVTDACNNRVPAKPIPVVGSPIAPGDPAPPKPVKIVSTFEELFFYTRGRLDVNASTKGEFAEGLAGRAGGVYTTMLYEAMWDSGEWPEVLKSAARATTKENPKQHPQEFENALKRDDSRKLQPLLDSPPAPKPGRKP